LDKPIALATDRHNCGQAQDADVEAPASGSCTTAPTAVAYINTTYKEKEAYKDIAIVHNTTADNQ